MNRIIALAALLTAATALPARADAERGLSLSLRASYGVPLGTAGDGASFDELTSRSFPVQLDVGWRFDEHWLAGAYFAWGPASIARDAKRNLAAQGATDITGHAMQRIGVQAIYSFRPGARISPWAGLALGYEWTRYATAQLNTETGSADAVTGMRGVEAILQAGGDVRLSPRFAVGPFASLSFGRYRDHVTELDVKSGSVAVPGTVKVDDEDVHEWLQFGIRGSFDL